jgi:prepilin-type N-terminal cleavage/methylation domain-containing protein
MKNQKGFTLIELLLVLAIIGIISAIAIPALLGQRARARDKSAVENATSILSDCIAANDKAKEANIPIATEGDLWAVMSTIVAPLTQPLAPQVLDAKNPWAGTGAAPATAYAVMGPLATGDALGARGLPATVASLGQVQTGFLPPDATTGAAGVVASAVYLQNPFNDPVTGPAEHIFYKLGNVE